ncbi:MAG: hypothetical protein ABIQ16_14315 [Polyangiaceae bacterium]
MPPAPTLLLTLALTACAGTAARTPQAQAAQCSEGANGTGRAASRLGPPSERGLGLRRVDRQNGAEPPIALVY